MRWVSMQEGNRVLTTPCITPFKDALKKAHRSEAARVCPMCKKFAVVNLAPHLLARQPDDTTHICHPALGGCNHGFSVVS